MSRSLAGAFTFQVQERDNLASIRAAHIGRVVRLAVEPIVEAGVVDAERVEEAPAESRPRTAPA